MVGTSSDDERIDDLEHRLEQQQQTIRGLVNRLPEDFGKRAFLAGGAGALAAGGFGAGRASAKPTGTGSLGTASDPLSAVHTNDMQIGGEAAQFAVDGYVVPVGQGLGVGDAIDPSSTSTPVQDAIDLAYNAGGGTVYLPPGTVEEADEITRRHGVGLVGYGIGDYAGTTYGTTISRSNAGANDRGMVFPHQTHWTWTHNVRLEGPGAGTATGPALEFEGTAWHSDIGVFEVTGWGGKGIIGGSVFSSNWDSLAVRQCDPDGAVVDLDGAGPALAIGMLGVWPADFRTGADSTCVFTSTPGVHINYLNIGGTAGQGVLAYGGRNNYLAVESINYEPEGQNAAAQAVVACRNDCVTRIGGTNVQTGTVGDIYDIGGGGTIGNNILGPGYVSGDATLTGNAVRVEAAQDFPSWYWGNASDVNSGGFSTGLLRCLGSAGIGAG